MWSFSNSRIFKKCQRQWFYKTILANAIAKDPIRHEAYLLSKLQTIYAWRGSIVDQVISTMIVPAIEGRRSLNYSKLIREARVAFDQQLKFAIANRMREPGFKLKDAGDTFAALHEVEYGTGITQESIEKAWQDVEQALTNFLHMEDLQRLLSSANHLVAQRALTFSYEGYSVKMVPDLIAFYNRKAPLIIDWKVHTFGTQDYRTQLACYALALTRCKPHADFPRTLKQFSTLDIELLEVQLLTKQQRFYNLNDNDLERLETFIVSSAIQMELLTGNDKKTLSPGDFQVANRPETCLSCSFRSLCWKESQDK